jgi:uncharacterized protein (TIGR02145 family)
MKKNLSIMLIWWLAIVPLTAQTFDFSNVEKSTVTDVDGNVYKTIRFGDTWWMAENLRAKHFNDGTNITQATKYINATETQNDWDWWSGYKRWAYTDLDTATFKVYGLTYSWYTATSDICPTGWSLPDTLNWFALGRLILGENSVANEVVTRNTPSGGTETVNEPLAVRGFASILKTDNGKVLGTNRYGDSTWLDGGYWLHNDTLTNECNASGMSIVPAGEIGSTNGGFGQDAYFWTPNYVHSDSSGQGRRAINFTYENNDLNITWFHNANMSGIRCIKAANKLSLSATDIGLANTGGIADSSITATANSTWTASTTATWLKVSQTVSSGNGKIIITALTANTEKDPRTDTVSVAMDELETQKIIVTQAGTTPLFTVSDTSLSLTGDSTTTVVFAISSTTGWAITSSADWLGANPSSGTGNVSITLTAAKNTTGSLRTASVTVSCPDLDSVAIITVTQKAATTTSVATTNTASFLLYPNPASDYLWVTGATGTFRIFSIDGKILKTGILQKGLNQIPVSGLSNGICFFQAGSFVKKWIKK